MKKLYYILVTLLFTLFYGDVSAQIKFFEISHDFGEIAEDGGKVEHIFRFRNTLKKPVVLLSAMSSCGCTKAEFSRKPVMPGDSAVIKIKYEPHKVEPGIFYKAVQIYSNESKQRVRVLTIQGNSIDHDKQYR